MARQKHKRRRNSLSRRMLTMALAFFALPSILLGLAFQTLLLDAVHVNYEALAMDSASRIADQLEYRMSLYEVLLEGVARNADLGQRLRAEYPGMYSNWETVRYIDNSFSYVYGELPGVQQFRVYHRNDSLVEDGSILWKPTGRKFADGTDIEWYERASTAKKFEWLIYPKTSNPVEMIAVLSACVSNTGNDVAGVVYLQLSMQRAFNDAIKATQYTSGSYAVIDHKNQLILSTESAMLGQNILQTPLAVHAKSLPYQMTTVSKIDEEIVVQSKLNNDWHLICRVPMSEFEQSTKRITLLQMLCTICVLAAGVVSIAMVVRNYSHRLRQLDERLRTMTHGELNVSLPVSGTDELTSVEIRFNRMVKRVNELMGVVENQKMREMEETIRTMESYVNPHFLYNTLSLVRWRALDNDDDELCGLVDDMTTYYRLSLSGGRSVVLIQDEVTHLDAYIAIQQRRYSDSVNVVWDIDEQALMAYTPKNILQTIVENSYVHGLIPEKEHNEIRVCVQKVDDKVCFTLTDNGMGMSAQRLETLESDDEKINRGIGIRSVRQRLKLYFGQNMKMKITSKQEEGTSVYIEIPHCTNEPTIMGGV